MVAVLPIKTVEPSLCKCGHKKSSHVPVPGPGTPVKCVRARYVYYEGMPSVRCRCEIFRPMSGGLLDP